MRKFIVIIVAILILCSAYLILLSPKNEIYLPLVHLCFLENTDTLVVGINSSAKYLQKVNYYISRDTMYIDLYSMPMSNFFLRKRWSQLKCF